MSTRKWLVIFAKEPMAGRVKTRLAGGIGSTPAAWWFRHQVTRLVRNVGQDPRWHTCLAIAPDIAVSTRMLPAGPSRVSQGPGNLGDRMGRITRSMPPGPVIIIGGDIPGIRPKHIATAFQMLGRHDAVLGPATDGGYWLIGMKRGGRAIPARLFRDVRWSTQHAMADTLATLEGMSIGTAATLSDVDTPGDLQPGDIRA